MMMWCDDDDDDNDDDDEFCRNSRTASVGRKTEVKARKPKIRTNTTITTGLTLFIISS